MLTVRRGRAFGALVMFVVAAFAALALASEVSSTSTAPTVFDRLGSDPGAAQSNEGRLSRFEDAREAFKTKPLLGEGFDSVRSAHDIYVQLLQAGGLLAFISFGVFVVGSIRLGVGIRRERRLGENDRNLAGALLAALAVWLLAGFFHNAIYDRYLYVPVGLLLGMALAIRLASRDSPTIQARSPA